MDNTLPSQKLNPQARRWRFLRSVFDPRAYGHLLRMLNYYNYSHVAPRRRLQLGRDVALSPTSGFSNPERIWIGDRSHIGTQCLLWAGPRTGRIEIGEDCLLGPSVLITAANYRFRDGSPVADQTMSEADVILGRDVWIGAHAIILPGTKVGAGAIIGAGSVVSGHVPPGQIITGPKATSTGDRFSVRSAA